MFFEDHPTGWLAEFVHRYQARTETSRRISKVCGSLADPLKCLNLDPVFRDICYPIVSARCAGSRLWDVDSNEYVDFCMGCGSALFGHNPPFLRVALARQIERGFPVGTQPELAGEVAKNIAALTGMERVAFACTGTEAIMLAVRLARTVTGRDRIALFSGSYHGQYDGTLAIEDPSGAIPQAIPSAPGILPGAVAHTRVLPYGTEEALEVIRQSGEELAAVLVEPVQSRRPDVRPKSFLQQLRRITERSGTALVFDEMITGFRLAQGGAQAWFDVRADLAVYGKAMGGGLPVAAVAGTPRYLNAIDGGAWSLAGPSLTFPLTTFSASTFANHPLNLAATLATLEEMRVQGPALQEALNQRTGILVEQLNHCLEQEQVSLRFSACGSLFGPAEPFDNSSMISRLLHYLLAERGFFLWGITGFLSTAHADAELDRLCSAVQESVRSAGTSERSHWLRA
jgi:glutamate-1-semialdehyde 2,1-aminomutase